MFSDFGDSYIASTELASLFLSNFSRTCFKLFKEATLFCLDLIQTPHVQEKARQKAADLLFCQKIQMVFVRRWLWECITGHYIALWGVRLTRGGNEAKIIRGRLCAASHRLCTPLCYTLLLSVPGQFDTADNLWCQIVLGVKLSAVSNCPFLHMVSNCLVSNCPRC